MNQTVLFAGGPLHGRTMANVTSRTVMAIEPPEISSLSDPFDPFGPAFGRVAYSVSKLAICGRIVWIGHVGTTPDENLVFEVLTSDGAKEASSPLTAVPAG